MWNPEKLKEWSKPALAHPELIEIARTASSNTQAKNLALEFTRSRGLEESFAKTCRWLRILRVEIGEDQFEEFIRSSRVKEKAMDTKDDSRGEMSERFKGDSILINEQKFIEGQKGLIRTLERDIKNAQSKIRARKREIARELGLVVSSVDELRCKLHPKSRFNSAIIIPDQIIRKTMARRETYICVECECEEKSSRDLTATTAFSCLNCGIVYGELDQMDWPNQGWGAAQYVCPVCGTVLDYYYGISD